VPTSNVHASQLLRPGLLQGVSILLAGASASAPGAAGAVSFASAVYDACAALGARVSECGLFDPECATVEERSIDDAADGALAQMGGLDLLVVDGAGLFVRAGEGARGEGGAGGEGGRLDGDAGADRTRAALIACLDASWNVTRAVANRAFLPESSGGRIVYLAPPADAGEHAEAARAGLENLARTLSIEWARHAITTVAIAPRAATATGEVAALIAYLASPAGAYFSGCQIDLRGPTAAGR
jgi:NAD(P)-dependent dehydrogenase (short-subunit alcohol dehydrogenase family)